MKILPGNSIPADGIIVKSPLILNNNNNQNDNITYYIDNSLITGESEPVQLHINDTVFGSTININQALYIK